MSAMSKPFQLHQDVTLLNAASFKGLQPATIIFATPPCQAFSTAEPMLSWESTESIPLVSCINLIKLLSDEQTEAPITYFIENVPRSAKFLNITNSLGQPIILEAH